MSNGEDGDIMMIDINKFYLVDAFTDKTFSGNPACVFLKEDIMEEDLMQIIAREFNFSETAFPVPLGSNNSETADHFKLKWFSPVVEVPLCGHATLATAHILFSELENKSPTLTFSTLSGDLIVSKKGHGYAMNFPAGQLSEVDIDSDVISALHAKPESVQEMLHCLNPNKLVIVVDREDQVRDIAPDFIGLIHASRKFNVGSIAVTSISESKNYDFILRNFAPIRGVNEDFVTGSAHVILGPYWGAKLRKKRLRAFQASKRGGFMDLEVKDNMRVELIGTAITVAEGTFRL